MNLKYQISHFTFYAPSVFWQAATVVSRFRFVGILIMLMLPALACGLTNPQYHLNNQIRLAVYQYERARRSPTNDLVIDFQRSEPRIKFEGQSENGGRTVWLYQLAAKEFFESHAPQKTYLYIQQIEFNGNHNMATVNVFRGDGTGYVGRQLMLQRDDGQHWSVVKDVESEEDSSN